MCVYIFRLYVYHFGLRYQERTTMHPRPNILNYRYICVHIFDSCIHVYNTYRQTISIYLCMAVQNLILNLNCHTKKGHSQPSSKHSVYQPCLAPQLFMLRFIPGLYCCCGPAEFTLVINVYVCTYIVSNISHFWVLWLVVCC